MLLVTAVVGFILNGMLIEPLLVFRHAGHDDRSVNGPNWALPKVPCDTSNVYDQLEHDLPAHHIKPKTSEGDESVKRKSPEKFSILRKDKPLSPTKLHPQTQQVTSDSPCHRQSLNISSSTSQNAYG